MALTPSARTGAVRTASACCCKLTLAKSAARISTPRNRRSGKAGSESSIKIRRVVFKIPLRAAARAASLCEPARIWWNWQTRYFEVVVPQGVQVQVLLSAPLFLNKLRNQVLLTQETAGKQDFSGIGRNWVK